MKAVIGVGAVLEDRIEDESRLGGNLPGNGEGRNAVKLGFLTAGFRSLRPVIA